MRTTVTRYHDISAGHRVVGHSGKCRFLHGHNYRIHFTVEGVVDSTGFVLDFGLVKSLLCDWLEATWDHRFLVWADDPIGPHLLKIDNTVREVPFNPTAENMAAHLLEHVCPMLLRGLAGVRVVEVKVEETAKCHATVRSQ